MKNNEKNEVRWTAVKPPLHLAGAAVVAMLLAACQTPQQQLYDDQETCGNMGASYGSSAHTVCMLQQQQRRDQSQLLLLEQQRLSYEIARGAQELRDQNN